MAHLVGLNMKRILQMLGFLAIVRLLWILPGLGGTEAIWR
jgi:hypothetical protein